MLTSSHLRKFPFGLLLLLFASLAIQAQGVKNFVTVDAARYQPAVSPDSIVAGFSNDLTTSEAWASGNGNSVSPGIQLPTVLNGIQVLVNNRSAELLYVGPSQINYIVPSATEVDAPATVIVEDDQGNLLAQGTLTMAASSLSLFTVNQSGTGMPAGLITADGSNYTPVVNQDGSTNFVVPGQYLVLFGTGVRADQDVQAYIGGIQATVEYAGSQNWYVGLDQINILVPASLAGQGQLSVYLTDGTNTSNTVLIDVGGNPSVSPDAPVITGFDVPQALAGQLVTVTGANMPASIADASVLVGDMYGTVMSVTPTSISFIVPYGVSTGNISVGNAAGLRQSAAPLTITTSISGQVLDNNSSPLSNVQVSIDESGLLATTDNSGHFILADAPLGTVHLTFDTSNCPFTLGLQDVTMSMVVTAGRDNEISAAIYVPVGLGGDFVIPAYERVGGATAATVGRTISNDGLTLNIPGAVRFRSAARDNRIGIYQLPANSPLPASLPAGIYPTSVALITSMGATFGSNALDQATLTFPNAENLPAGSTLDLYAYRPSAAPSSFVRKGVARVSAAGDSIVATGIDVASIWFVAKPYDRALSQTVSGLVVDASERPVSDARVYVKGRTARTDKSGHFEIRGVRAEIGENLKIDVGYTTPGGSYLTASKTIKDSAQGMTDAGSVELPARRR